MSVTEEIVKKVLETQNNKTDVTLEELTKRVEQHFDGERFKAWCQTCGTVFIDIDYNQYLKLHSWDNERPDKWFVLMFKHYVENQEHTIMHSVPAIGWTNFTPKCKSWYDRQKLNLGSDEAILLEIDRYVKGCTLPL